jgi:ABC-2 type transport system ATP-binding protein
VASLRQVLDKLHDARIDVASLSLHTPDLDDVFFAVTGRPTTADADHEQKALQS